MKIIVHEKFDFIEIQLNMKEKILSVHGSFENIPVENIKKVSTLEPESSWNDIKSPGTDVGLFKGGTFISSRGIEFWCVYKHKKPHYLVIELKEHRFARIILTVKNNIEIKNKIENILERIDEN